MTFECFAPAKINLSLHVTGQRADGYHLLQSLVVFADVGDQITFSRGHETALTISGPFAKGVPDDARNLLWKAAELVGETGVMTLEKNLPHGAGIGGGSSDAGALLRVLGSAESGAALGADVPVCRYGRAAMMSGVGDQIAPVNVPELHAVLVNPGVHVPTPDVFKALTNKENPEMDVMPASQDVFIDWLGRQRNDLQAPAISHAPEIADVLDTLGRCVGQQLVRMSGSGATCFALFETAEIAQAAAVRVSHSYPRWWVKPCVLS